MSIDRITTGIRFHYVYLSRVIKSLKRVVKTYIQNLLKGADVPEYWVDEKAKIVYVVNAKAACSSIQSALYRYATRQSPPRDIHAAPETRRFHRARLTKEQRDQYFVFTFVRNPVDRVLSCYKNKFPDIRDNRKIQFEFGNYLGGLLKRKDSFAQFVDKLKIIPPKYCDRHFVPQYYWIYKKCRVSPDFVGKVEHMERDWSTLQKKIDGLPGLEKINLSKPMNVGLNEKSKSILKKKYQEDFQRFGYSLE